MTNQVGPDNSDRVTIPAGSSSHCHFTGTIIAARARKPARRDYSRFPDRAIRPWLYAQRRIVRIILIITRSRIEAMWIRPTARTSYRRWASGHKVPRTPSWPPASYSNGWSLRPFPDRPRAPTIRWGRFAGPSPTSTAESATSVSPTVSNSNRCRTNGLYERIFSRRVPGDRVSGLSSIFLIYIYIYILITI